MGHTMVNFPIVQEYNAVDAHSNNLLLIMKCLAIPGFNILYTFTRDIKRISILKFFLLLVPCSTTSTN